jgi:hypothetical protein
MGERGKILGHLLSGMGMEVLRDYDRQRLGVLERAFWALFYSSSHHRYARLEKLVRTIRSV